MTVVVVAFFPAALLVHLHGFHVEGPAPGSLLVPGVEPLATVVVIAFFPAALLVHLHGFRVAAAVPGFVLLAEVGVVAVIAFEVVTPGPPKFVAFPNACSFPNPSSSAELAGEEVVDSSIDALAIDAADSHPASLKVFLYKRRARFDSRPNLNHSSASDTNVPPTDATTSRHKKRCLHSPQEQRRHMFPAARSTPAERKTPEAEAAKWRCA